MRAQIIIKKGTEEHKFIILLPKKMDFIEIMEILKAFENTVRGMGYIEEKQNTVDKKTTSAL